ncbi:hypothetical protein COB57_04745 [Candidatus Peregrinibacteria bacterium]|nr:MAG: hypothetical protein COB57_04745 [Candidatus Peregrinibacteria bacterium]
MDKLTKKHEEDTSLQTYTTPNQSQEFEDYVKNKFLSTKIDEDTDLLPEDIHTPFQIQDIISITGYNLSNTLENVGFNTLVITALTLSTLGVIPLAGLCLLIISGLTDLISKRPFAHIGLFSVSLFLIAVSTKYPVLIYINHFATLAAINSLEINNDISITPKKLIQKLQLKPLANKSYSELEIEFPEEIEEISNDIHTQLDFLINVSIPQIDNQIQKTLHHINEFKNNITKVNNQLSLITPENFPSHNRSQMKKNCNDIIQHDTQQRDKWIKNHDILQATHTDLSNSANTIKESLNQQEVRENYSKEIEEAKKNTETITYDSDEQHYLHTDALIETLEKSKQQLIHTQKITQQFQKDQQLQIECEQELNND